jgi:hypothetical protein
VSFDRGTMLKAGQVFRMPGTKDLWRVDYANECRARVVPLAKRHVTLGDGREFDAERGGVNISPYATVELVTDLERARDEQELAEVEAELAAAKKQLEKINRGDAPANPEVRPMAAALKESRSKLEKLKAQPKATGGGWHVASDKQIPEFKAGSLNDVVLKCIKAAPGLTTKQLVDVVKAEGNVAACVSRFNQAGYIVKRG